jgi:hypothetical protein
MKLPPTLPRGSDSSGKLTGRTMAGRYSMRERVVQYRMAVAVIRERYEEASR